MFVDFFAVRERVRDRQTESKQKQKRAQKVHDSKLNITGQKHSGKEHTNRAASRNEKLGELQFNIKKDCNYKSGLGAVGWTGELSPNNVTAFLCAKTGKNLHKGTVTTSVILQL